ncbi:MAG: hypothetical protein WBW92_13475, partial [Rhodanobacteraceae bacterium]
MLPRPHSPDPDSTSRFGTALVAFRIGVGQARLQGLEHSSRTHAGADAHGHHAVLLLAPAHA